MAYTFTDGEVATKAKLDTLLPSRVAQAGVVQITPVANTPTSVKVTFPSPFPTAPTVLSTPITIYPGSAVRGTSVSDITATGFTLWITRSNTNPTSVAWVAFGGSSATFSNSAYAWASLLNAGVSGQVIKAGVVTINPTAGTATGKTVTFPAPFAATPVVVLIASSVVVGTTVEGWSVSDVEASSFKAWIERSTSTDTGMLWIAVGR